jgi:hypothetical protein
MTCLGKMIIASFALFLLVGCTTVSQKSPFQTGQNYNFRMTEESNVLQAKAVEVRPDGWILFSLDKNSPSKVLNMMPKQVWVNSEQIIYAAPY